MATPTRTTLELPGSLGPIRVAVDAGGRESARPAVVILHGFKGFMEWGMFPFVAERLARAGFSAVRLTASGSGADASGNFPYQDRFARNTAAAELGDLSTVVNALGAGQLGTAPPTRIGLLGHSRGGGMVILHAARDPRVRALVTWAAIASVRRWNDHEAQEWRQRGYREVINARTGDVLRQDIMLLEEVEQDDGQLNIARTAARIACPWLIVHGVDDASVRPAEAHLLQRQNPGAELLEVPNGDHTFGAKHPWQGATPALDRALGATTAWFARHLT